MSRLRTSRVSISPLHVLLALIVAFLLGLTAAAAEKTAGDKPTKTTAAPPDAGRKAATKPKEPTAAERIADLSRAIEEDAKQLEEFQAEYDAQDKPDSEYTKAKAEYEPLDAELKSKKKTLEDQKDSGNAEQIKALTEEIDALEKKRTVALNRFELAVEGRKTLKSRLDTLRQKHEQDKKALAKLMGEPDPTATPTSAPASQPVEAAPAPASAPAEPTAAKPAPAPAAAPGAPAPGMPGVPPTTPASQPVVDAKAPPRQEVVEQQAKVEKKEAEAKKAEEKVQTIQQQIDVLTETIQGEIKALELARKAVDNAREASRLLDDEYDQQYTKPEAERLSPTELQALRRKAREADDRALEDQKKARQLTDRIRGLEEQRAELQRSRILAFEEAEEKQVEAQAARDELDELTNPYSLTNILQWFIDHGPKILLILVAMVVGQIFVRVISGRIAVLLARSSGRSESQEDRENRAKTLVGVFRYTASVAIIVGGMITILEECGVDVGVVLGGAAVIGLAVAFGAQNLVRDYFHGFVMLLENQYGINDVVRIGGISGLVERVTLRVTVLRDLEGIVHFVPNGQITSVSNMTHGWSRALFEVGVAYKEDVDRVIDVIVELGHELRKDPILGPLILEDLTMLGVDAMAESAIMIKFFVKTRPLQQWTVRREMLRRIKKRFDKLGIEIPFPHRKIYHFHEGGAPSPETAAEGATRWGE